MTQIKNHYEALELADKQPVTVRMRQFVGQIFEQGVASGVFKPQAPIFFNEFLSSILTGIGYRVVQKEFPYLGQEFAAYVRDAIIDGISVRRT